MIKIGEPYIKRIGDKSRLSAEISISDTSKILWFELPTSQEEYFGMPISDPFVFALLPFAMQSNRSIKCEGETSERLQYYLESIFIPKVSSINNSQFHKIEILSKTTNKKRKSLGGVGVGFSAGLDSLYSIYSQGKDIYPITHLCAFNTGVFEGDVEYVFNEHCKRTTEFAKKYGYETVFLNSNIYYEFPERFVTVCSFRNIGFALALQGLLDIYYLSAGGYFSAHWFNFNQSEKFNTTIVPCASTENMRIYLSGVEASRFDKLDEITNYEPSKDFMHPCIYNEITKMNCGKCRKCINDQVYLYSINKLDEYKNVFPVKEFKSRLPIRLGFAIMYDFISPERLENNFKKNNLVFPKSAYDIAKKFDETFYKLDNGDSIGKSKHGGRYHL